MGGRESLRVFSVKNSNLPLVSVCIVTYNHGHYIRECLQSILDNGYPNTEVIVSDDGSSDNNLAEMKKIFDARLSVSTLNRFGPSANLNAAIQKAKGQYAMTFSGDDVLLPGAIQKNVELIQEHGVDLLFSTPQLINEKSELCADTKAPVFFSHCASDSADLFRTLFLKGNFLCATGTIVKTEILKQHPFCFSSIQLQDFEQWIRFSKKYKVTQVSNRLIQYRIREKETNLSSSRNKIRSRFELMIIYESFFDGVSREFLRAAFPEECKNVDSNEEMHLAIAFIYLKHELPAIQAIGLKRLYFDMQSESYRKILEEKYKFTMQDFFALGNQIDFCNLDHRTLLKKLIKKVF